MTDPGIFISGGEGLPVDQRLTETEERDILVEGTPGAERIDDRRGAVTGLGLRLSLPAGRSKRRGAGASVAGERGLGIGPGLGHVVFIQFTVQKEGDVVLAEDKQNRPAGLLQAPCGQLRRHLFRYLLLPDR